MKTQLEYQKQIVEQSNINIVVCGNCANIILHEVEAENIKCEKCYFESEPCDFPDLNY